jgi:putative membrane protein
MSVSLPSVRTDRSVLLTGLVMLGALALWWLSETVPAELPSFLPWDFSWIDFPALALPVAWYLRGLAVAPASERPHLMRTVAFLTGTALLYGVTQTRFVYLAQHMFFINRLQQLGMHHIGPFLVALGWPGAMIARGMPRALRRLCGARPLHWFLGPLQNPFVAGFVFVALLWLWLLPAVHLPAMVSPALYEVMNLSMIIDGLLFWFLILDPRGKPAARLGHGARLVTIILICFPEMLIGARLTFTTEDYYPYYDLCGRLLPDVGALLDQHLGGLVVWIPSSMLSSVAFLLIVNNLRLQEERLGNGINRDDIVVGGVRFSSSSWTGR